MSLANITKGWAAVQIGVLVISVSGAAFPLVAQANSSNNNDNQEQIDNHDNGNNDNQHQDENKNHDNDQDDNDEGHGHTPPPPVITTAHIVATKVVCDSESALPNWGAGGPDITATTASDFVTNSDGACHLQSGWNFEWAPNGSANPGDNLEAAGGAWTAFGPTSGSGVTSVDIPATTSGVKTWFREELQSGYIPFTGVNGSDVSAEMYCNSDVLNYDNYDWIDGAQAGSTYYCVAFNAPTAPVDPVCTESQHLDNHICVDNTPVDPTCTETQHLENHVCVDNTPVDPTCTETQHLDNHVCVDYTTTTSHGHSHSFNKPSGQVLGASCGITISKHIKFGSPKNDPEQVTKLQTFLNKWMGSNLAITGVYDTATLAAVNAFQAKYSSDVLKPWGIDAPTGLVYLSTVRFINLLECPDLSLPLPALVDWQHNPNAQ
jgi:hypothetical protein